MPTLARAQLTEPESPWGEPFDQMYKVLCRDRVPILTALGFYAEHDLSKRRMLKEAVRFTISWSSF
jgi:hypothetical protein